MKSDPFINSLTNLLKSYYVFQKNDSRINKKNPTWVDYLSWGVSSLSLGLHTMKAIDEGAKLVDSIKKDNKASRLIDARLYFAMCNPVFLLLDNQSLQKLNCLPPNFNSQSPS